MAQWTRMFSEYRGVTWVKTGKDGGKHHLMDTERVTASRRCVHPWHAGSDEQTVELHRLPRAWAVGMGRWIHIICAFVRVCVCVFCMAAPILAFQGIYYRVSSCVCSGRSGFRPKHISKWCCCCVNMEAVHPCEEYAWRQTKIFIVLLALSLVCGCHTSYPRFSKDWRREAHQPVARLWNRRRSSALWLIMRSQPSQRL